MKFNMKKRTILLFGICFIILIGALGINYFFNKSYFQEIKYDEVIEKMNNKESFILVLSQTYCEHCASYKPKVEKVANDEKIMIYYLEVDLLNEEEKKEFKNYISYSSTPLTVFIVSGEEKTAATRIVGDASEEKILKKLKSNGYID